LREGCGVFTHPFLFPLSNSFREEEQLNRTTFASPLSFSKKRGEGGDQEKENSAKPRRGLM